MTTIRTSSGIYGCVSRYKVQRTLDISVVHIPSPSPKHGGKAARCFQAHNHPRVLNRLSARGNAIYIKLLAGGNTKLTSWRQC